MNEQEIIFPSKKLNGLKDWTERYIVLYGGRGSAKSWSIALMLLIKSLDKKVRILCTREIQKTIRDSVHKLFSDTIDRMKWNNYFTITIDSIKSVNGSEFIFKGLHNNPDDIKSLEGIDYAWVEEAQRVSRRSLETLIPTIRKDGSRIYFTYNPTNIDDPVHVDYNLSNRPDVRKVELNYNDNDFFPEVLKCEMEWDRAHDIDKYYHIWEGKIQKHSEAQVFFGKWIIDNFESSNDQISFYCGMDFGFSKDPSAVVRCFIQDMNLYIDYEAGGIGIDTNDLPAVMDSIPLIRKIKIVGDSARPETISALKRLGFYIVSAVKGKGSVEDGISKIRSFKKVIIHERCKHVIDEFRNYSYKVDPLTNNIAMPYKLLDIHNHYIDALRYALEDVNIERAKEIYNRFGVRV